MKNPSIYCFIETKPRGAVRFSCASTISDDLDALTFEDPPLRRSHGPTFEFLGYFDEEANPFGNYSLVGFPPKDVPADLSVTGEEWLDEYGYCIGHSYVTLTELLEYDWLKTVEVTSYFTLFDYSAGYGEAITWGIEPYAVIPEKDAQKYVAKFCGARHKRNELKEARINGKPVAVQVTSKVPAYKQFPELWSSAIPLLLATAKRTNAHSNDARIVYCFG